MVTWKVPIIVSPEYPIKGLSKEKYDVTFQRTFNDTVFQVTIEQHFSFWFMLIKFQFFLPYVVL